MSTLLVILQNAYGVPENYVPDFALESFSKCLTGRRLRNAIPPDVEVHIRNASPLVGRTSDSNFPPSAQYVQEQVRRLEPDVILFCGKNAREVADEIEFECAAVFMPHPAWRRLSNRMLENVKRRLQRRLQ